MPRPHRFRGDAEAKAAWHSNHHFTIPQNYHPRLRVGDHEIHDARVTMGHSSIDLIPAITKGVPVKPVSPFGETRKTNASARITGRPNNRLNFTPGM